MREVLDKHDLLFSVGGDLFTWSLPSNIDPWPAGLPLIHLDTDPWQIGKNYPAKVAILGDPKATLPDITAAVGARMTASAKSAASARLKSATETIKKDLDAFRAKARAMAGKTPVQPLALLEAIGAMLPKDAVVIEEILSSRARHPLADQQRRRAELLRPARRRHRLGIAGGDRRQGRAARPAGGGARSATAAPCTRCRRCGPRRVTGCRSSG